MIFWPAFICGLVAIVVGLGLFWKAASFAELTQSGVGQMFGSVAPPRRVQRSSTTITMRWVAVGWCAIGLFCAVGSFFDIGWGDDDQTFVVVEP